jgi:hypothetical protein
MPTQKRGEVPYDLAVSQHNGHNGIKLGGAA